mgnify:CR=1 FL=1
MHTVRDGARHGANPLYEVIQPALYRASDEDGGYASSTGGQCVCARIVSDHHGVARIYVPQGFQEQVRLWFADANDLRGGVTSLEKAQQSTAFNGGTSVARMSDVVIGQNDRAAFGNVKERHFQALKGQVRISTDDHGARLSVAMK